MLSENELLYTLALQRVPNLGDTSAKKLIRLIGSPEQIFKEKKSALLKIDGIGKLRIKELDLGLQLPKAEAELRFIQANKIGFNYFLDPHYPDRLKHCHDAPILFFKRGNISNRSKKMISIVGTRKVTTYGTTFCKKLLEDLAPLDPIIVSGFAYGVDITAQKTAMDLGLETIGCLAHGLSRMYPATHKKYVTGIEERGGFITEFWSDDSFDRNNFLKRNRIIAGLSEATIVIESAKKGGSLVTADIANSYNREVFAVPGRTTDSQSEGCNDLIKTNNAHVITSAADLIYMLGWELEERAPKATQTQLFIGLSLEEQTIYDYLKSEGKQELDAISLQCKMPTFKVAALLLQLELREAIRPLPGKLFEII